MARFRAIASSTAFNCFRSSSRRRVVDLRTPGGGDGELALGDAGRFLAPLSTLFLRAGSSFFTRENGSVFLIRVSLIWGFWEACLGGGSLACRWANSSSKLSRSRAGGKGGSRYIIGRGTTGLGTSFSTRFLATSGATAATTFLGGDGFLATSKPAVLLGGPGFGGRLGELDADETLLMLRLRE